MKRQYIDPMFKTVCPGHVEKKPADVPQPKPVIVQQPPDDDPPVKYRPSVYKRNTNRRDNAIAAIIAVVLLVVWGLPILISFLGPFAWLAFELWLNLRNPP